MYVYNLIILKKIYYFAEAWTSIFFSSFVFQFEFHNSGYVDLIDRLGVECVPEEYGGKNGPIDYGKSLKFILSREKLLARGREFGYKK